MYWSCSNDAQNRVRGVGIVCLMLSLLVGFVASAQTTETDITRHYVLGNGDRISIQVFDEPDLTLDALVSDTGAINYSYLGAIEVGGKTPQQIEVQLTEMLSDGYLVNPSVNVTIKEYRPFFINGEVKRPGGYAYQPGLTVDRAIALAGGLTDRASKRKMYILKAGASTQKRSKVKMGNLVSPGDVITIDEGFF